MLYIVRHGTTTFNSRTETQEEQERIRGWLPIPLDNNGIEQAKEAAIKLVNKDIKYVYTSPLERAVQTAKEISHTLNVKFIYDSGLTPWNIGEIEGMLVSKAIPIMTEYFKNNTKKFVRGESYIEFYDRWKTRLTELLILSRNKNICVITHSRNLYCLEHVLTNGLKPIVFTGEPIPGGIVEINPDTLEIQII